MKKILFCACFAALGYSNDTFYAKADNEGRLIAILKSYGGELSTNYAQFNHTNGKIVAILKHSSSYLTESFSEKSYYVDCNKSVLFGNSNNEKCTNPFFSLSSPVVMHREQDGDINVTKTLISNTILTPIAAVFGTVIYEKKFDKDKYNRFIDNYGLERNKQKLFIDLKNTNTQKFVPCDLTVYDAKDYTSITPNTACKHASDEGLFVYQSYNTIFSNGPATAIGLFSSADASNPLKISKKIVQRMVERYMDVFALYPEIPLPKTLPQLVLEKSQFEKEANFQKRKNKALKEREEEQKELNEGYINAVKKQNFTIFEELEDRKRIINKKIAEFRKLAFMAVATPPEFIFKNYDAENEKLYGKFKFGIDEYNVVSNDVNPKIAEKIYNQSIELTPQANYALVESDISATFQTKELLLVAGSDKLKFDYTDNRYQPPSMSLVIPSYDISAFKNVITEATKKSATISLNALKALQDLEQYRVKSQLAISDTAIHRVNAKTPQWYEKPSCAEEKCSVGRGETQAEALKVALAQLGCIIKSSITSNLIVEKIITDDVAEQKIASYTIQQTCSNTMDDGSMNITNTSEMDGWYYVRVTMNLQSKN